MSATMTTFIIMKFKFSKDELSNIILLLITPIPLYRNRHKCRYIFLLNKGSLHNFSEHVHHTLI